jgi:hypothetical protein
VSFRLPEYDGAFVGFIQKATHELARVHHPLLAEMRFEDIGSGASTVVDSREGELLDLPSERVRFEMTSEHEDIRNSNFEPLLVQLDSGGAEFGEQLMKIFFSSMSAVTESTGNVIDAEGKGFSFDLLYALLEKMEFSLDDNDELVMPSIVMHPNQIKNLPEETPEERARIEAFKEQKREELLAQRRSRRLS